MPASHGMIVHDGGPAPLDGSAHTFSVIFEDGDVRNSFVENDILDMVPLRRSGEVGRTCRELVATRSCC